jgi:hypothetical protein
MELAVAHKHQDDDISSESESKLSALPPLTKGFSSPPLAPRPKPLSLPKRQHHLQATLLAPTSASELVSESKPTPETISTKTPESSPKPGNSDTSGKAYYQPHFIVPNDTPLTNEKAHVVGGGTGGTDTGTGTTTVDRPSTPKVRLRYYVNPGDSEKSVYFPYPLGIGVNPRSDPKTSLFRPKKPLKMKFLLYWERNCIKRVFKAAGLVRSSSPVLLHKIQGNGDWHVAWTKHFPIDQYKTLKPNQRVNSFPGTGCIGRKDTLASILARFDRRFLDSDAFKFVPATFTLRGHYGEMDRFLKAARLRAGHTTSPIRYKKRRQKKKSLTKRRRVPTKKQNNSKNNSNSDSDDSSSESDSDSDDNELEREQQSIEALKRRAELDQHRMSMKSKHFIMDGERMNSKREQQMGSDLWICKPSASACGRGIRLVKYMDVPRLPMTIKVKDRTTTAINGIKTRDDHHQQTKQRVWNVQEYIADPLCIEGKKFDLRVYVLVTSFDPLRVYVFREGLCRICTNEYDLDYNTLNDTFKHLTNFSINKNADKFVANSNADKDDEGHKWSLSALFDHLDAHGYDVARLWRDMKEVAVKTLIACESEVFTKLKSLNGLDKCCYEVFGFDMLLNESLFVYLIEVNIYPSMATGSPLDKRIKETMITDALHIKGVPVPSKENRTGNLHHHSGGSERMNRIRTNRATSQKRRETLKRRLRTGKLGKLSNQDVNVIRESATEFSRAATTNYDIAFPSAQSIKRLSEFFICPRYNNTLLHMLIHQSEEDDDDEPNPKKKTFQSIRTGRKL